MQRLLQTARAVLLLFLFVAATEARAEAPPARVILVFDASGSMAGHIEGRPKIEVAREVVGEIVSGIDPKVELGLIAYGHRRKGDCGDIELLVPPAPGSGATVLSRLATLKPIGKTPLTAAVIEAAGHLRYTEERASVILVSDGEETCGQDPCAAAAELEAAGVDFTCHVVGFALKPGESVGLECLAKQTGGLYLSADTAATLTNALQEAVRQVMQPVSRLVVEPRLASGGSVVEGARFQLLRPGGGEVASGSGGLWSVELPEPGRYQLRAEREGKSLQLDVEIGEGSTLTREVVFTETGIRASAREGEGAQLIESGLVWTLFGAAEGSGTSTATRPVVASSYDPEPFLRVDPGTYLLRAERGGAVAELEVEVGQETPAEVTLVLGSGRLELAAIIKEGEPPLQSGVAWYLLGQADAEGDRPTMAHSYEPQPVLSVPAGRYLVRVTHDSVTAEREVVVSVGRLTEEVISLQSGTVKAAARVVEGGEPIEAGLAWNLFGEPGPDGDRPLVSYSYDAQPTFFPAAGRYTLEVTYGSSRATRDLEVEVGGKSEVVVILGSGNLRLSALAAEGAEPLSEGLSWNLLGPADADGQREEVSYSYDPNPTLTVPAGTYLLTLEWGNARTETEVSVAAGDETARAVVLNAGTIHADAVLVKGGAPIKSDLSWSVLSSPGPDGERQEAGYSFDPTAEMRFNAGRYLLQVRRGEVRVEKEVEVRPNRETRVTLDLNAGLLRLKTTSPGRWNVLAEPRDGGEDWLELGDTLDEETEYTVPAGKVLVRRNEGDRKVERQVEVRAGEVTELSLELK